MIDIILLHRIIFIHCYLVSSCNSWPMLPSSTANWSSLIVNHKKFWITSHIKHWCGSTMGKKNLQHCWYKAVRNRNKHIFQDKVHEFIEWSEDQLLSFQLELNEITDIISTGFVSSGMKKPELLLFWDNKIYWSWLLKSAKAWFLTTDIWGLKYLTSLIDDNISKGATTIAYSAKFKCAKQRGCWQTR